MSMCFEPSHFDVASTVGGLLGVLARHDRGRDCRCARYVTRHDPYAIFAWHVIDFERNCHDDKRGTCRAAGVRRHHRRRRRRRAVPDTGRSHASTNPSCGSSTPVMEFGPSWIIGREAFGREWPQRCSSSSAWARSAFVVQRQDEATSTDGVVDLGPVENFPVGSVVAVDDPPLFVLNDNSTGIAVLDAHSTHLGCILVRNTPDTDDTLRLPNPEVGFIDPCHGSTFDRVGNKLAGPAGTPAWTAIGSRSPISACWWTCRSRSSVIRRRLRSIRATTST